MTESDIENVVAGQAALIAALDAGDIAGIEAATASLSQLLAGVKAGGTAGPVRKDRVDYALRQGDAARTRVNYLADRTRQRLDRLREARGGPRAAVYDSQGRVATYKH